MIARVADFAQDAFEVRDHQGLTTGEILLAAGRPLANTTRVAL
jgi:hypothetical protein